jgi:hypothetical protein
VHPATSELAHQIGGAFEVGLLHRDDLNVSLAIGSGCIYLRRPARGEEQLQLDDPASGGAPADDQGA